MLRLPALGLYLLAVPFAQAAPLDHGVQPEVYAALIKLKSAANLTQEEFASALLSQQYIELAATTLQPTLTQLEGFAEAQMISRNCARQYAAKLTALTESQRWIPNTLQNSTRRTTYLKFTSKINLTRAEAQFNRLTPADSCVLAASKSK